MTTPQRAFLSLALASTAVAVASWPTAAQSGGPFLRPPRDIVDVVVCRTDEDRVRQAGLLRPRVVPVVSQGLSFMQDPPVLAPDYLGTVALRDFAVLGDVPTVRFKLDDDASPIETWERTGTKTVNGQLVSLFNPTWSSGALDLILRDRRWGWDQPAIIWGEFLGTDKEPGTGNSVWLRIASTNLPRAAVAHVSDSVQYSSHVVNLVMPDFGDGYITEDHNFDLRRVGTTFYQHFADEYEGLAIIPQDTYLPSYGAFHRNVQNTVRGIGASVFDVSTDYGSATRRLRSVELYSAARWGRPESSSHEIAHQWANHVDWTRLTGLVRSGHQPSSHDPLWSGGETLIGSILTSFRRVTPTDTGWAIEHAPQPPRFHPFTLYAMGLLGKEGVPEVTIFDEQAQLGLGGPHTPAAGLSLTGPTRTVTVHNVIGMLGERAGPVDTVWRRATIVVSRQGLLSQREMDYWTYFSQRLEDPNGTGTLGYNGSASFDASTYGRMDLRTDIRPLNAPPLAPRVGPDNPTFGRRDFREFVLDEDVPSRIRAGDSLRLSGVVNARDRADVNQVLVRLWKSGGTSDDAIRQSAAVSDRSSFQLDVPTRAEQRGLYALELFLFWPGAGPQYSRITVSPFIIE